MDKKTFCKRFMLWTAVLVAAAMLIIGLCFGKIVEANLAEEVGKWIVGTLGLIGIFEVFAYILAPLVWHIKYDGKNDVESLD
jgi:hypothetical protein